MCLWRVESLKVAQVFELVLVYLYQLLHLHFVLLQLKLGLVELAGARHSEVVDILLSILKFYLLVDCALQQFEGVG